MEMEMEMEMVDSLQSILTVRWQTGPEGGE